MNARPYYFKKAVATLRERLEGDEPIGPGSGTNELIAYTDHMVRYMGHCPPPVVVIEITLQACMEMLDELTKKSHGPR